MHSVSCLTALTLSLVTAISSSWGYAFVVEPLPSMPKAYCKQQQCVLLWISASLQSSFVLKAFLATPIKLQTPGRQEPCLLLLCLPERGWSSLLLLFESWQTNPNLNVLANDEQSVKSCLVALLWNALLFAEGGHHDAEWHSFLSSSYVTMTWVQRN